MCDHTNPGAHVTRNRPLVLGLAGALCALAILAAVLLSRGCQKTPAPRGDDDITLQARALEFNPDLCLAFVRDMVKLERYDGFLRGPTGTLWAGAGNDADRASLLRALLDRCGVESQLAGGTQWGVRATVKGKPLSIGLGAPGGEAGAAAEPSAGDWHRVKLRLGSGTAWVEREWNVADLATAQAMVVFDEKGEAAGLAETGPGGARPPATMLPLAGLKRLDLVIECRSAGGTVTTRTREIFTEEFEGTPARRHAENVHSVFVTAGWVPEDARLRDLKRLAGWQDRVAALHRRTAFAFLARSDAFARDAAAKVGVTAAFDAPRVTIVSSERDGDRVVVSLDLRKNDLRCDGPPDARVAFNALRSLHDGALESQVLAEVTGVPATSADDLLANAFAGEGATLAERQSRLEGALRRMLAESPDGSLLSASCAGSTMAVRRTGGGLAATPLAGGPTIAIPDAASVEDGAASIGAALAATPRAPLVLDYAEREVDRWYRNCRFFYLWGAESRLEFERQFTAFEPALELVTLDYYDELGKKWLDQPWRGTTYVAKEDLENADTFTTWYINHGPEPVGYTIDMLSRRAFRELKEKGSVVLKAIGSNEEKLEPIRLFLVSKTKLSLAVNNVPREFDVIWIQGDYESKNPKKPVPGQPYEGVKDAKGLNVSSHYVLDDPDYPFFMPWSAFIQSSVQGRVVDAETGRGIDGASVSLKGPNVSTRSWPGGTFTFPTFRTPFGEFELRAAAEGYEPLLQTVDFRNASSFPLRIALRPNAQGDPFAFVTKDTLAGLDGLSLEEHSKALIRAAIAERPQVVAIVPRFAVACDAGAVDAWLELDSVSGEIYGRMQDGLYGASTGAGWNISNVQKPYKMQRKVLNYFFGRIAAWYLFAAGALDSVEKTMDNPGMTMRDMHRNAVKVARDLAKMYDTWVLKVPGNPVTDRSFLKGLRDGLDWAEKYYGEAWKD